jgi:hypothetical protein
MKMSHNLTAKAAVMDYYKQHRASMGIIKTLMFNATTRVQFEAALYVSKHAWNFEAGSELMDDLTVTEVPMGQQILALRAASLANKRAVLASMPIIDVSTAAAYLGMTQPAFNHFAAFHHNIFGYYHMNQCRYSMDELVMVQNNPEWMAGYRKADQLAMVGAPDYHRFDKCTAVDEKVAMAFCNLTRHELPKVAYGSQHGDYYSLADLEKIRVTKLTAQQQ